MSPFRPAAILSIVLACSAVCAMAQVVPPGAREFGIARLKYTGGGDWYGNQSSLKNLLAGLRSRTHIAIAGDIEAVVEPGSATLFQYPFVFASGHGNIKFSEAEAGNLRRYLLFIFNIKLKFLHK